MVILHNVITILIETFEIHIFSVIVTIRELLLVAQSPNSIYQPIFLQIKFEVSTIDYTINPIINRSTYNVYVCGHTSYLLLDDFYYKECKKNVIKFYLGF